MNFTKEVVESIESLLEELKKVIWKNIKPHEIDGEICIEREVIFRYRDEIGRSLFGIMDVFPNPHWGEAPCEISNPLLLIYLSRGGKLVFMIKTSLHRDDISKSLSEVAKEIKKITGYDYILEEMRHK